MPPAADGHRSPVVSRAGETAPGVSSFDRAVRVIEQELAVTQGVLSRVQAACDDARIERAAWARPEHVQHFCRLAGLAITGSNAARTPVLDLLCEAAAVVNDPWDIFSILLQSRDRVVCHQALDGMCLLAAGSGYPWGVWTNALARAVETGGDVLREADALKKIARIVRGPAAEEGAETPAALYVNESAAPATRRLAARMLDALAPVAGYPVAVRLLGRDLAEFLEPYLAFTRATHLDLLELASGAITREALLQSLRKARSACGPTLFRDVVSDAGWHALNTGMSVQRWTGISVGGSFPLLLTPQEATFLDGAPGVRTVFERVVVVADALRRRDASVTTLRTGAIERFRASNLRHADLLGQLLDMSPLTDVKVRRMLRLTQDLVEDFQALFAERYPEECDAIADTYRGLRAAIEAELAAARPGQPLPPTVTRLVQMFEDPSSPSAIRTLHGCKRYLHQRGLQLGAGLAESAEATNHAVTIVLASPERVLQVLRSIEYADFEAGDADVRMPVVVRAAIDGFIRQLVHGHTSFPSLRLFCYGNEVHCFAAFRNHPAFIRVDFSPPHRGGMIDLEYCGVSKYELEWHPNVALDAIQQMFRTLDFDVQVANTRIHARYDKERAVDLHDLLDRLTILFRLVPYFMDLDWTIADLDLSPSARREVAEAWARFFSQWGVLPIRDLLTADRRGVLVGTERTPAEVREIRWSGEDRYRDRYTVDLPPGFWEAVRGVAERRDVRLPEVHEAEPVSQQSIETRVVAPVREWLKHPSAEWERLHEATVLAGVLVSDEDTVLQSARVARMVTRLAGAARFVTTGTVNGYDVQRATLPLGEETLGLYALCDGAGIPRLAIFTLGVGIYARGKSAADAPEPNWLADVELLAKLLRRANFGVEWIEPGGEAPDLVMARMRSTFAASNPSARPVVLEGERLVVGVKASPGRAVGLARPGLVGRAPADLEGAILLAAAVGPRDNPFVFRASGIVSTGGGVLSHAGLLALQFGKPALVVKGRWERTASGAESLVFGCSTTTEVHRCVGAFDVTERREQAPHDERIEDGDLVALDADEGTLRVLGHEHDALVLHDDLRQLAASSRALASASADPDLLAHRGRMLRARYQIEKLLARVRDPVLASHAAGELLIGEAGREPHVRHEDKARLLKVLFANPWTGPAAVRLVEAMTAEMARRAAAVSAHASRLIATSKDPLEVLTLRLDAIRSERMRDDLAGLLSRTGVSGLAAPAEPHPDRDTLAHNQLQALRATALVEVQRATESGCAVRAQRHVLRQLERLERIVETPDGGAIAKVRARLDAEDEASTRAASTRRIVDGSDGGLELWPLVGSKAANLAELERLGARSLVPRWFAVTDRAFREALELSVEEGAGTLGALIERTMSRRDLSDAQKSAAIRDAFERVALPPPLVAELSVAYAALRRTEPSPDLDPPEDPDRPFVAVRSSALEEDREIAARAGEFDTFLFVRGIDGLCAALRRAWSGLWTERAIHNRAVLHAEGPVGGGVLVQRMVRARAAGVLHTVNLAERRMREMVINAGLGLGEGIVSGLVAADLIVVSKEEHGPELRFRYGTNDKRERVVFDSSFGSGTRLVDTLPHQRLRPVLEYVELGELAAAAMRLESAYREPLDIEFAIEGSRLWLLQVRPVPAALAAWRETVDRFPLARRRT